MLSSIHCPNFFLSDSREHTGTEVSERDMPVDITLNPLRFILRCEALILITAYL